MDTNVLIVEIDDGNFNIEKDKIVFIKERDVVRFVGCSKLNAAYTPFIITDRKVELSSRKDVELCINKPIKLPKADFNTDYKLICGRLNKNGYWIADEQFSSVGPVSLQMIFCLEEEDHFEIVQFGEQEYFIVESQRINLENTIIMTVFPRCIGKFQVWKQFFERQVELGYNAFHLPPIQELGMSNSYYSISNQTKLSSQLFPMEDKYEVFKKLVDQFNKRGVFFFVDIVLNHTSNTSEWIKEDLDAVYTVENTPDFGASLVVDCAIFQWGQRIKDGSLQGYSKKAIETQEDLTFLMKSLSKILENLNIWQFFQLKQSLVDQMYNMLEPSVPSENIFVDDPSKQIQKIIDANLVNLGVGRYRADVEKLSEEWVNSGIKYERNDLVIARDSINSIWRKRVDNWMVAQVPTTVIQDMRNRYLNQKWSLSGYNPVVERIFSKIQNGVYAVNNGWVHGFTSLENIVKSRQFYYLRRRVNVWGDLVKLRYGNSKSDSPKLWKFMRQYVQLMAQHFNGFRIDNCHNTPLHVGQYFIRKARLINPSLVVFAQLFTNSKQEDSIYIKRMGINALVKQVIYDMHGAGFARMYQSHAGVNSTPLGGLSNSFLKSGERRVYIKPRRPVYVTYELTHDNKSYTEMNCVEKQLPVAVLLSFINATVGTFKGFDQYYKHHIYVTETRPLYQQDGICTQEVERTPKLKVVISYSEVVPSQGCVVQIAGSWTSWQPVKMQSNNQYFYYETEIDSGASCLYKFIVNGKWTSETNRRKVGKNGDHFIDVYSEVPRRTIYSNLQGVRRNVAVLRENYQIFDQIVVENVGETVMITKENSRIKNRFVFVIASLTLEKAFGKFRLIGTVSSAVIWRRVDGNIIESSSLKEFFDVRMDEGDTILYSGALPPGFSCVIETSLDWNRTRSLVRLQQMLKDGSKLKHKLDTFDLNTLLFTCSRQEQVLRGVSNYELPELGQLPYGGIGSLSNMLENALKFGRIPKSLYRNIKEGNWMFNYIMSRLSGKPQFKQVYDQMAEFFSLLEDIPKHQIPNFFSRYICLVIDQIKSALDFGALKLGKSEFNDNLALASYQFFCRLPCTKPEYEIAMSAGLPHFTVGWARSWGRDTFISIELLLLHPKICRGMILIYAKNLRHGLIPNLLDSGNNPRFNSRDAAWWFVRAVKQYANLTGDYEIFKEEVQMNFLDSDIDIHNRLKQKGQEVYMSVQDIVQQIFQKHWDGISFRQWKGGIEIDSSMTSDGFNIDLKADPETGFVVGGNGSNCLTWMDKMGSAGATKGLPATSRNGAPVEMVGLLHHNLLAYEDLYTNGYYKYPGVKNQEKLLRFSEWGETIKTHFQERFWIPENQKEKTHPQIEVKYIKRRGIYKDVVRSQNLPEEEYRLRPNALIALALSPTLFNPQHALVYIKNAERILIKPKSIGVGTLDRIIDSLYCEQYDNEDYGPVLKKAHGFGYHNGPEWVWLYGFYIKAVLNFRKTLTPQKAHAMMQNHVRYIAKSDWMSLPQLTNVFGVRNKFSCSAQAWSISSLLLAVSSIQKLGSS